MKRLNYYLGIVVLLTITIVSCRNEIFTEKTEQVDPNAILFKSNVVSLSQSKHRNKLLPEISATKKQLSNAKYKASNGKIINFGDISIDTDHVVYIENGQNYHNYIFKITRENGTENLPLENILFTPLPDGSYKEFLISYNITQQERHALEQGIWRVPKERITINEIKKGTYSNTIFQKTSSETCNWVAVDTYTFCSANVHFHGEGYPDCTADLKSQLVTTFVLKCESVDDGSYTSGGGTTGGTWEGGSGDTGGTQDGGTDGSGSGGGTSPCSGTGIYTQPQDPTLSTDTGCDDGVPTLPNLGECKGGKIKDANGNCVCPQGKEENSFGNCVTPCDTSKEDLKKVFPNANVIVLQDMAIAINKYGKDFGIDTKEKLQHFLAQAGHESAKFTVFTENLNYRWEKLDLVWGKYFNSLSNPNLDPNKANPNDYKRSSTSAYVNVEKFANYVYGNRMGNNAYGDGYKYRGRGIFQLTGKNNYTAFNNFYRNNYDSSVDIINNPDLLTSNIEMMVISALWFYKNNVLNRIKVNENTSVKSVSVKVNGGTNGLNDRIQIFNIAINIIKCL